jgi:hypothetical protein
METCLALAFTLGLPAWLLIEELLKQLRMSPPEARAAYFPILAR